MVARNAGVEHDIVVIEVDDASGNPEAVDGGVGVEDVVAGCHADGTDEVKDRMRGQFRGNEAVGEGNVGAVNVVKPRRRRQHGIGVGGLNVEKGIADAVQIGGGMEENDEAS